MWYSKENSQKSIDVLTNVDAISSNVAPIKFDQTLNEPLKTNIKSKDTPTKIKSYGETDTLSGIRAEINNINVKDVHGYFSRREAEKMLHFLSGKKMTSKKERENEIRFAIATAPDAPGRLQRSGAILSGLISKSNDKTTALYDAFLKMDVASVFTTTCGFINILKTAYKGQSPDATYDTGFEEAKRLATSIMDDAINNVSREIQSYLKGADGRIFVNKNRSIGVPEGLLRKIKEEVKENANVDRMLHDMIIVPIHQHLVFTARRFFAKMIKASKKHTDDTTLSSNRFKLKNIRQDVLTDAYRSIAITCAKNVILSATSNSRETENDEEDEEEDDDEEEDKLRENYGGRTVDQLSQGLKQINKDLKNKKAYPNAGFKDKYNEDEFQALDDLVTSSFGYNSQDWVANDEGESDDAGASYFLDNVPFLYSVGRTSYVGKRMTYTIQEKSFLKYVRVCMSTYSNYAAQGETAFQDSFAGAISDIFFRESVLSMNTFCIMDAMLKYRTDGYITDQTIVKKKHDIVGGVLSQHKPELTEIVKTFITTTKEHTEKEQNAKQELYNDTKDFKVPSWLAEAYSKMITDMNDLMIKAFMNAKYEEKDDMQTIEKYASFLKPSTFEDTSSPSWQQDVTNRKKELAEIELKLIERLEYTTTEKNINGNILFRTVASFTISVTIAKAFTWFLCNLDQSFIKAQELFNWLALNGKNNDANPGSNSTSNPQSNDNSDIQPNGNFNEGKGDAQNVTPNTIPTLLLNIYNKYFPNQKGEFVSQFQPFTTTINETKVIVIPLAAKHLQNTFQMEGAVLVNNTFDGKSHGDNIPVMSSEHYKDISQKNEENVQKFKSWNEIEEASKRESESSKAPTYVENVVEMTQNGIKKASDGINGKTIPSLEAAYAVMTNTDPNCILLQCYSQRLAEKKDGSNTNNITTAIYDMVKLMSDYRLTLSGEALRTWIRKIAAPAAAFTMDNLWGLVLAGSALAVTTCFTDSWLFQLGAIGAAYILPNLTQNFEGFIGMRIFDWFTSADTAISQDNVDKFSHPPNRWSDRYSDNTTYDTEEDAHKAYRHILASFAETTNVKSNNTQGKSTDSYAIMLMRARETVKMVCSTCLSTTVWRQRMESNLLSVIPAILHFFTLSSFGIEILLKQTPGLAAHLTGNGLTVLNPIGAVCLTPSLPYDVAVGVVEVLSVGVFAWVGQYLYHKYRDIGKQYAYPSELLPTAYVAISKRLNTAYKGPGIIKHMVDFLSNKTTTMIALYGLTRCLIDSGFKGLGSDIEPIRLTAFLLFSDNLDVLESGASFMRSCATALFAGKNKTIRRNDDNDDVKETSFWNIVRATWQSVKHFVKFMGRMQALKWCKIMLDQNLEKNPLAFIKSCIDTINVGKVFFPGWTGLQQDMFTTAAIVVVVISLGFAAHLLGLDKTFVKDFYDIGNIEKVSEALQDETRIKTIKEFQKHSIELQKNMKNIQEK